MHSTRRKMQDTIALCWPRIELAQSGQQCLFRVRRKSFLVPDAPQASVFKCSTPTHEWWRALPGVGSLS